MDTKIKEIDFQDRRKAILPTLYFTIVFFVLYYLVLIIPKYGINSEIFLIDNLGGVSILSGFVAGIVLSKKWSKNILLLLPSFGALGATCLFLSHTAFYHSVNHLWLSAQIIGIIYASFLGSFKSNLVLLVFNAVIPPILATQLGHVDSMEVIHKQAIAYFASIVSLFFSYNNFNRKKELFRAQQKALESIKSKSTFLANMSHEIRTPMNGILGFSNLLLNSNLTHEQRENTQIIQHSAQSLLGILNDILDFSKIESGKLEIEKRPFNYQVVIKDVFSLTEEEASKKKLDFKYKFPSSYPKCLIGDSNRLRQILLNLISNAIKFTEQGAVFVQVKVEPFDTHTVLVTTSVQDTGIGMSAEQLKEVFKSFNQADLSITRKYGGTGLGTTISKKLTELMGGTMEVQSKAGEGSVFKFSIPFEIAPSDDSCNHKEHIPKRNYQATVLMAEDNKVNQKLAIKTLQKFGIQVIVANDGQEAVEFAQELNHSLILMDIQMPNKDGLQALSELKSHGYEKPVIAMTANVMKEQIETYKNSGFADYISKPFELSHLIKTLDNHLLH